jgi:hypothetical protein
MGRMLVTIASALLMVLALVPGRATADGSWLDNPPPDWNTPGMAVPPSPHIPPSGDARCFDALVVPGTPGEQAVAAAGWFLFDSPQSLSPTMTPYGEIEVVFGQSSADGMCRPAGYQAFVFVGGVLAGTLSPNLMLSRDDGALIQATASSETQIQAEYVRYTSQDALCCPSARSTVWFGLVRTMAGPVMRLVKVSKAPTTTPATMVPLPQAVPSPAPIQPPVQAPAQVPRSQ